MMKSSPAPPNPMKSHSGESGWRLPNGKLHREDGPALVKPDGTKMWYWDGKLHRVDGPAVVGPDGEREWFFHGKPHRVDGPAFISATGHKQWQVNGMQHRVDGPAVIHANGDQEWYLHGKRHRTDGPAIVQNGGADYWFQHGLKHRTDGPAGTKPHDEWYIRGYVVEVTRWDMESLEHEDCMYRNPDVPPPDELMDFLDGPDPYNYDYFMLFRYIMKNMSPEMLHHVSENVAAVAAWHLPIDDDYIAAAVTRPVVRTIMQCRDDVPEHAQTFVEVAA